MLRVRAIKCFYWDWMLCRVRVRASNKMKQIKIQIAIRTLPRSIRLSPLVFKWSWLASKPQKGENSARVLSRNWIRLRNESRRREALFITLAEHSFSANVHDAVQSECFKSMRGFCLLEKSSSAECWGFLEVSWSGKRSHALISLECDLNKWDEGNVIEPDWNLSSHEAAKLIFRLYSL